MKDWADQIRSAMLAQRVTVATLSEQTGISKSHLYRILDERKNPSFSKVLAISKAMGFDISWREVAGTSESLT